MKRLIAILLALVLAFSCAFAEPAGQRTEEEGQISAREIQVMSGGEARVFEQDGRITFIEGDCAGKPVRGAEDAMRVIDSLRELLKADDRTHLEPWQEVRDPFGNIYYVFQQTYDNTIVLGGAAKLVTSAEGKMLGLTCSLVSELPEGEETGSLTAEEAERLVASRENSGDVVTYMTRRIVLPVDRMLDLEADEVQTRFVWAVYTTNPHASVNGNTDLPYLAHYVSMSGEYLYCLPTILPGDAAGLAGYDAEYVFQFMEPAEYTGYVDWSDGSEREITVTLMRDTRTGMYYLGNIEHKIVVADCWEFLYNGGNVVLEYSADNREWDQVGLMSLYNYCRADDYYREIGWEGCDGAGTPIIVLKDFCDQDHRPIDNAAYAGKFYGWQCFLSSAINDFAQCLDVCAHEFTHAVTGTLMTYNGYLNDAGSINEAMSDIHGNLCEMLQGATEDMTWMMGEHSRMPVRSMSSPHSFGQPEHSWDFYYQAKVKEPTDINDRGGVHTNSSLLNHLAYLLCEKGGMTLAEARSFWFAMDCVMVPGTDFAQLRQLLPWMLKVTGLTAYEAGMAEAISATRLGDDAVPEQLGQDQAMLVLQLPDNEVFNNGNWALNVITLDVDTLIERAGALFEQLADGNYSGLPEVLQTILKEASQEENRVKTEPETAPENEQSFWDILFSGLLEDGEPVKEEQPEEQSFWDIFFSTLLEEEAAPAEERRETAEAEDELTDEQTEEIMNWLEEQLEDLLYNGIASAGQDGRTIRTVSCPGRTIPVLMYIKVKPNSDALEQMKIVIYLNHHWVDLTGLFSAMDGEEQADSATATDLEDSGLVTDLLEILFSGNGLEGILDGFSVKLVGGEVTELPATGLDQVTLDTNMAFEDEEVPEVNNRKSRPKLPADGE